MDKLDKLFEKQEELQKRLGNMPFLEYRDKQAFINIMTLAVIDETMEAIRETEWKPWKKSQNFNQQAFRNEIIDLWHFVINLTLAADMNASDLYEAFNIKNEENHKRQDEGY